MIIIANERAGFYAQRYVDKIVSYAFPGQEIKWTNDENKATFLVRSHFGTDNYKEEDIPYITFSGESYEVSHRNYPPVFQIDSLLLPENPLSFYIPYAIDGVLYHNFPYPELRKHIDNIRPYFLAYCARNPVQMREELFRLLRTGDKTETAHGLGWCSNTNGFKVPPGTWENLTDIYKDYRFALAMENSSKPGYITEKIINVFVSGAIPIFWGDNQTVLSIFNPAAFVNLNDFADLKSAAKYIIELDADPARREKMRRESVWKDGVVPDLFRIYEKDYIPTTIRQLGDKLKTHLIEKNRMEVSK
jgi:hypothetical protein